MKRFVGVMIAISALTLIGSSAIYNEKAIGATDTTVNDFSAVTSGPGNILPDSKFYFLDKLYQEVKLSLVFTPKQRAQLHMQIMGERMAELRAMQARDNKEAIVTALTEVERESLLGARDLRDAAARGDDTVQVARDMRQTISDTKNILVAVADKYPDSVYASQLSAASDTLSEAREIALTALPDAEREHELTAYASSDVDEAVLGISTSAGKLEDRLKNYEKYASNSANSTVAKQREQKIAEIKRKIADLQAQLKTLMAQQRAVVKATPTPKK